MDYGLAMDNGHDGSRGPWNDRRHARAIETWYRGAAAIDAICPDIYRILPICTSIAPSCNPSTDPSTNPAASPQRPLKMGSRGKTGRGGR